ncbi:hypothetical protein A2U01_0003252 [Trifolium medium]|uniref:Uncharacterized protein n=1 Tax=Trifolium medium TaxID=97028 RepID=A0A392M536_9FABA|nr:hypothetical protein [Trifolium medium]
MHLIHIDVTLADLKHQLSQLNNRLNYRDARRVTDVEYRRSSVCTDRSVLFIDMKFQNDGDVRTTFSIFSQYSTKGPIELDVTLVRSVQDICLSLIRPRIFDEITACMVEPEDDKDEVVNLSYS